MSQQNAEIPTAQNTVSKKKSKKKLWIGLGVVAVLIVVCVIFVATSASATNGAQTASQTATAEKGNISATVVGSGNLEAADTIDVVVPTGILIKDVSVESGDVVTKGQTLATLDKASVANALIDAEDNLDSIEEELDEGDLSDLEVEKLEAEKSDTKATVKTLNSLYKSLKITATQAGTVGSVNVVKGSETTQNSSDVSSSDSAASAATANSMTGAAYEPSQASSYQALSSPTSTSQASVSQASTYQVENASVGVLEEPVVISDFTQLTVTAPVSDATPQNKITATQQYSGSITWDCTSSIFQPGTKYTATIILTAQDGYLFKNSNTPVISGSQYDWRVIDEGFAGNKLRITATFEKTAEKSSTDQSTKNQSSTGTDTSSGTGAGTGSTGSGSATPSDTSSSLSSGYSSASGSTSGTGVDTSTSTSSGTYSSYEAVAFTIDSGDDVKVAVSVDELDILSIEIDQSVTVTLDAVEGEEFSGTVTKVAANATTDNNSAKYTVQVTMPKTDQMRTGMSASASIITAEVNDVVLIPINALQETGGSVFVYTEEDSEGNLSGAVEVETGLSDGRHVEIIGGLQEGDTVYYSKMESSSDDMSAMMSGQGGSSPYSDGTGQDGSSSNGEGGGQSGSSAPMSMGASFSQSSLV